MGLKFLNKKGWHTGSLRNIENVWKAEQKHEAEQKKLEELRKQLHEERERSDFRRLQEEAGLVPKQERLDFLYDSGLAVGKPSSSGFKELESFPKSDATDAAAAPSSSTKQQPSVPGALFEEKPQSANDAWRKLHSDPLLLIRQREQEALARVKNNPVQMAMIRKSVEAKKHKEKTSSEKERPNKHHDHHHKKKSSSRHQKHESHRHNIESENVYTKEDDINKGNYRTSKREERSHKAADPLSSEDGSTRRGTRVERDNFVRDPPAKTENSGVDQHRMGRDGDKPETYHRKSRHNAAGSRKLSEEERAAKLREMQMDAEVHEEQRWKRLKKAEEDDARESSRASPSGRNFLDAANKSVYGADKGGSSTIEESVRRRTHYSQGRSQMSGERNAFRR